MRFILISSLLCFALSAQLSAQGALADSAATAWTRGQTDLAYRLYRDQLARDSTNTLALHRVALMEAWRENHDRSLALFDRLLRLAPDDEEARVNRARVLMWTGRTEEALDAVERVLAVDSTNARALELRSDLTEEPDSAAVAWIQGDTDRAYELYAARLAEDSANAMALHRVALMEAWRENHEKSLALFDRLLELAPDDQEARVNRARVLMWTGKTEEALDEVEGVLAENPKNEPALQLREELTEEPDSAVLAWNAGDTDRAYRLYTARLASDSTNATALHRVALMEAWRRNYEKSLALFDRLLEVTPDDEEAKVNRAQVLAWSGRPGEALAVVEGVLSRDPTNIRALEVKAQAATWANQLEESLAAYDLLMQVDTAGGDRFLLPRARVLGWAGDHAQAIEAFESLMESDPDNPEFMVGLARVLGWSGDNERAASLYRRALAVDPSNLEAQQGLAQVTAWQGDLARSETLWREILNAHPEDFTALVGLATTLRWQGRYDQAEDALERAERVDSTNVEIENQRQWLDPALAPKVRPTFTYESDSDGNRVSTVSLTGSWPVYGPVEVSVIGTQRLLRDDNNVAPDRESRGGQVSARIQAVNGWSFTAGIGAWDSDAPDADQVTTSTVAVNSPGWRDLTMGLNYNRSVFDFTALVVQNAVSVDEISATMRLNAGQRTSFSARAAKAYIDGSESNTRLLGIARLDYRAIPWLTVGAAVRSFSYDKDLDDGYWDPEFYGNLEVPLGVQWTSGRLLPAIEISPGYQEIEGVGDSGASFRARASLTLNLGPFRQMGIAAVYASSGLHQISPAGDSDYKYHAVNVFGSWAF